MSGAPVGVHSCVVNPRLKEVQTRWDLPGGKYGRTFPGLPSCEVDVEDAVGLDHRWMAWDPARAARTLVDFRESQAS